MSSRVFDLVFPSLPKVESFLEETYALVFLSVMEYLNYQQKIIMGQVTFLAFHCRIKLE
jgi:hypothetical protein